MSDLETLREAWEGYSVTASIIDGHAKFCDMRYKSTHYPCNCGFTAVEQAIKRVLATQKAGGRMTTLDILRAVHEDVRAVQVRVESDRDRLDLLIALTGLQTLIADEEAKTDRPLPERPYSVTVNESEKF